VIRLDVPRITAMAAVALSLGGCYQPPPGYYSSYGAYTPSYGGYTAPQVPVCRETHLTATIGGQPQDVVGTACRQPDGTWRLKG
jgi:hypothetical protein